MSDSGEPELCQLRRIAFRCWDPLGLDPHEPARNDAYDAFLLEAAKLLQSGASVEEAAFHLFRAEGEHLVDNPDEAAFERADMTANALATYLRRLDAEPLDIRLDAGKWRSEADLWSDLLRALGAPAWHGHNYDALWETVTEVLHFGESPDTAINAVQPPFRIGVANAARLAPHLRERLTGIAALLAEARAEYGIETSLTYSA